MINGFREMLVVEYSLRDKKFNIQTVEDMLEGNLYSIYKQQDTTFIPVAIVSSPEEATKAVDLIKEKLGISES